MKLEATTKMNKKSKKTSTSTRTDQRTSIDYSPQRK